MLGAASTDMIESQEGWLALTAARADTTVGGEHFGAKALAGVLALFLGPWASVASVLRTNELEAPLPDFRIFRLHRFMCSCQSMSTVTDGSVRIAKASNS